MSGKDIVRFFSPFTSMAIEPGVGTIPRAEVQDTNHLRLIRLWNFLEPCAVFGLLLFIIWYTRLDPAFWWLKPSFYSLLVWMLLISPIIHYPIERKVYDNNRGFWYYFFEARGLGSPLAYYLPLNGKRPHILQYWKTILGVVVFLDVLFVCALFEFNDDIIKKFALDAMSHDMARLYRIGLILGIDCALIFVVFPFMLRLDNFQSSYRFMAAFMLILLAFVLVGNILFQMNETSLREIFKDNIYMNLRGDSAAKRLATITPVAVGAQWAGYVFWGFIQELFFLGIFGVQFSRAFDVTNSKVQRVLYCLCTASFFAMIHIPNFWLGVVTFTGGLIGALFFVQCRNLFAFGIVHGFGGTVSNRLLPIWFSVGPR